MPWPSVGHRQLGELMDRSVHMAPIWIDILGFDVWRLVARRAVGSDIAQERPLHNRVPGIHNIWSPPCGISRRVGSDIANDTRGSHVLISKSRPGRHILTWHPHRRALHSDFASERPESPSCSAETGRPLGSDIARESFGDPRSHLAVRETAGNHSSAGD